MRNKQQFVICGVKENDTGWDLKLGPDKNDPWVSVPEIEFPVTPEIGDIAMVLLPEVIGITTPV